MGITNLRSFTVIYGHLQPFTVIYGHFTVILRSFTVIYGQPSQAPPKKGKFVPPFLNCTSEVTQCFLYTNVTLLHNN